MAARPWNLQIRSTPRARQRIRVVKTIVSALVGMFIVYTAIWGMTISVLAGTNDRLLDEMKESFDSSEGNKAFIVSGLFILVLGAALMLLKRHRPGGTVMSIVEERMAFERDVLFLDMEKQLAEERAKLDDWKNEQIRLMYQVVLDQQARGLLPCPNCREQHRDRGIRSA